MARNGRMAMKRKPNMKRARMKRYNEKINNEVKRSSPLSTEEFETDEENTTGDLKPGCVKREWRAGESNENRRSYCVAAKQLFNSEEWQEINVWWKQNVLIFKHGDENASLAWWKCGVVAGGSNYGNIMSEIKIDA